MRAMHILASGMLIGAFLAPNLAKADNDVNACGADRPCMSAYQQKHNVVFENHNQGWDVYNVRYKNTTGGYTQKESPDGGFTVTGVGKQRTVQISVQGCNKRLLQSSVCSPWSAITFTTK
jgi:hypothetical protein